ncbi:hypothetical protein D3C85_1295950 [compost metagenome]
MLRLNGQLTGVQHFMLRKVMNHLCRRFGARCEHVDDFHAIDFQRLDRLADFPGGRDQRDGAVGQCLRTAKIQLTAIASGQGGTELVLGASTHGVAGHDIFGNRMLHEPRRCDDLYLARLDVSFIDDAFDAAIMVDMTVVVDHRQHRLFRAMRVVEIECGTRGFGGHQGVDDDESGLAFDDGHVGQVDAADLIEALRDLVQTVRHVLACL